MKRSFCLFLLFLLQRSIKSDFCPRCQGKVHRREDLRLTENDLIIDKKNFCYDRQVSFLIIVKSGDFQRRNFTRFTWAKELIDHFNIPILYALALPKNGSMQKSILDENELYQDILQFNFEENYYNLTLKTISVFHWYTERCLNRSRALLYVDDDLLIHVDRLMMNIHRLIETNSIYGWFEKSGLIQRSGIGGVSVEDFAIDRVPDYLWGAAVLYPSAIIHDRLLPGIYRTDLPIFFRDDVFINGFIAEQMSVKRKHWKGIRLYDQTEDDLKHQMILIDFPNEEHRHRAWSCFQEKKFCNKTSLKLLKNIFFYVIIILIVAIALGLFLRRYIRLDHIKSEISRRILRLTVKRKSNSTIGSSNRRICSCRFFFNLRRISLPFLLLILLLLLIFYRFNHE